jgi:hypothetical protein
LCSLSSPCLSSLASRSSPYLSHSPASLSIFRSPVALHCIFDFHISASSKMPFAWNEASERTFLLVVLKHSGAKYASTLCKPMTEALGGEMTERTVWYNPPSLLRITCLLFLLALSHFLIRSRFILGLFSISLGVDVIGGISLYFYFTFTCTLLLLHVQHFAATSIRQPTPDLPTC